MDKERQERERQIKLEKERLEREKREKLEKEKQEREKNMKLEKLSKSKDNFLPAIKKSELMFPKIRNAKNKINRTNTYYFFDQEVNINNLGIKFF